MSIITETTKMSDFDWCILLNPLPDELQEVLERQGISSYLPESQTAQALILHRTARETRCNLSTFKPCRRLLVCRRPIRLVNACIQLSEPGIRRRLPQAH